MLNTRDAVFFHPHKINSHGNFLQAIAYGQENEVKGKLEKSKKNRPDYFNTLLLGKSAVIDNANRQFYCTGLQYAAWAYDIHMVRMLLSFYDTEALKEKAINQLNELEHYGLIDIETAKSFGSHYDFKPYIEKLEPLVEEIIKLNPLSGDNQAAWDKLTQDFMNLIRPLQETLPAQAIQEMCRPDRCAIDKEGNPPTYNEETLPRTCEYLSRETNKMENYLPFDPKKKPFCMIRGNHPYAIGGTKLIKNEPGNPLKTPMDLAAIKALAEIKGKQLQDIRSSLENELAEKRGCLSRVS